MNEKAFILLPIVSVFLFAIFFLLAFGVVLAIKRRVLLTAVLAAGSFSIGTFVAYNPAFSSRMISSLTPQSQDDSRLFDTFGQQVFAGLFRSPENLAQAIVVGSFMFGFSAAVWGLLFWYADRRSENAADAIVKNAEQA